MKEKYSEDIQHIRNMMESSTRFLSLSGLAGITAGVIALISSGITFYMLNEQHINYADLGANPESTITLNMLLLAMGTLVLSLSFAIYFTLRKSNKNNLPIFTKTTYNVIESLAVPLLTGAFVCLAFILEKQILYVAPSTLLFYGLALIATAKYTYGDIKILGYGELILGVFGYFFLPYGLVLWTIGFGFLHLVYGVILYKKYK